MATLILDPHFEQEIRADRADRRIDRYDEVWDGTYLIAPPKDVEHSETPGKSTLGVKQRTHCDRGYRLSRRECQRPRR